MTTAYNDLPKRKNPYANGFTPTAAPRVITPQEQDERDKAMSRTFTHETIQQHAAAGDVFAELALRYAGDSVTLTRITQRQGRGVPRWYAYFREVDLPTSPEVLVTIWPEDHRRIIRAGYHFPNHGACQIHITVKYDAYHRGLRMDDVLPSANATPAPTPPINDVAPPAPQSNALPSANATPAPTPPINDVAPPAPQSNALTIDLEELIAELIGEDVWNVLQAAYRLTQGDQRVRAVACEEMRSPYVNHGQSFDWYYNIAKFDDMPFKRDIAAEMLQDLVPDMTEDQLRFSAALGGELCAQDNQRRRMDSFWRLQDACTDALNTGGR